MKSVNTKHGEKKPNQRDTGNRRLPFRGAVSVREDAGLGSDEGL